MTWVRAVVVAVTCGVVLTGCGSEADPGPAATTTTTTTTTSAAEPTPTAEPTPRKERAPRPESGEVEVDGMNITGEWEDREVLGTSLELPGGRILYATRWPRVDAVSVGIRDGGRILRTISALIPEMVEEPDGIDLYGGDVRGDRGPDERVADGTYLVLGSVPGDVELSVAGPDGREQPVTGSSTKVLPGFTVFYVAGDWEDGWDQVQLAPLTVSTDDGGTVAVRERSWTG